MRRGAKLGRLELLAWINKSMETDYPRIESLCDGIVYLQFIDMCHPKTVMLSKLNCKFYLVLPKSQEDNAKNLRLLDDAFHKLSIRKAIDPDKLALGKFGDNMEICQWFYSYVGQYAPKTHYNAYSRRVEAYKKQKRIPVHVQDFDLNVTPHLIPNSGNLDSDLIEAGQVEVEQDLNGQRLTQLRDLVASLEQELTNQVQNYKLLQEDITQVEEERNHYFLKLRQIELLCNSNPHNEISRNLLDIISETPPEFLPVEQLGNNYYMNNLRYQKDQEKQKKSKYYDAIKPTRDNQQPVFQNCRAKIDELRNTMEAKIRNLLQDYHNKEERLLQLITDEDEKKVIKNTRPEILGDSEDQNTESCEESYIKEIWNLKKKIKAIKRRSNIVRSSMDDDLAENIISNIQAKISNDAVQDLKDFCKVNWEVDVQDKEAKIRKELDQQFNLKRQQIRDDYEREMNHRIEQSKYEISEYYTNQINQLKQGKVQQMQIDKAKIRQQIIKELQPIFDQQFYDYQDRIRDMNSSKYAQIQQEVDNNYKQKLEEEKLNWKQEIGYQVLPKLRQNARQEVQQHIQQLEQDCKKKASQKIEKAVENIQKHQQEIIQQKVQQTLNYKQNFYNSMRNQMKKDIVDQLKKNEQSGYPALIGQIKQKIERDLRYKLVGEISIKLKDEIVQEMQQNAIMQLNKRNQNQLRKERIKQNQILKQQREKIQKEFNKNIIGQIQVQVQQRKKELLKQYKRRLNSQLRDLQNSLYETEDMHTLNDVCVIKKQIEDLENEKLNLRLQLKQTKQEMEIETKQLQEDQQLLQSKLQESIMSQSYINQQSEYSPLSQSPTILRTQFTKKPENSFYDEALQEHLSKPFLDSQDIYLKDNLFIQTLEFPKELTYDSTSSPDNQLSDRKYLNYPNSSQTAKLLIAKNLQEARKKAQDYFKNKTPLGYYRTANITK